jgi:hypothetical protein
MRENIQKALEKCGTTRNFIGFNEQNIAGVNIKLVILPERMWEKYSERKGKNVGR